MLENERIIVDRGGIDPGIAALMQNANKGFDPAALMAMMNFRPSNTENQYNKRK